MPSLESKLAELHQEEKQIRERIDARNKNRKIKCACMDSHKINSLTAIQTHHYIPPQGCTGGDYWTEGELQFICPETGAINRVLFDNCDVPYKEREYYANNPEEQFKRGYKHLFKEVENRNDTHPGVHVNTNYVSNFYVDQNRKKFGLVEKRKPK